MKEPRKEGGRELNPLFAPAAEPGAARFGGELGGAQRARRPLPIAAETEQSERAEQIEADPGAAGIKGVAGAGAGHGGVERGQRGFGL